jgi:tat-translocated enzyme
MSNKTTDATESANTPAEEASDATQNAAETANETTSDAVVATDSGADEDKAAHHVSRRAAFGFAGAGLAAGALAGAAGGYAAGGEDAPADKILDTYPFRGKHQAGILTPAQDNMFCAAFDVTTTDPEELKQLLSDWTVAAQQMTAGELVGGEPSENKQAVPRDTGEAWGYKPNGLTITFGFGRSLFVDSDGKDRFGIAKKMPKILSEGMPKFANENIRSADSDGDLLVQACSNDAQVCAHAIRNLNRIAMGTAKMRWSQTGYGRTSSTSVAQETPRNLFGFKDGTNNIKSEDGDAKLNEHLWVQKGDDSGADWMTGGTYFVVRKIHMFAEMWDNLRLIEQEQTFGRDKRYGAPLNVTAPTSGKDEFKPIDFKAKNKEGELEVPADSHIAIVNPEQNKGRWMLRRGYNYTEGSDALGRLSAGLFFIAFVRDPRTNFYPILDKMTQKDALSEYLQHQARALFAIPAGIGQSDTMVGQALFS